MKPPAKQAQRSTCIWKPTRPYKQLPALRSVSVFSIGYIEHDNFRMMPLTIGQIVRDPGNASGKDYYYGLGVGIYPTRIQGFGTSGENKNLFGGYAVIGLDVHTAHFRRSQIPLHFQVRRQICGRLGYRGRYSLLNRPYSPLCFFVLSFVKTKGRDFCLPLSLCQKPLSRRRFLRSAAATATSGYAFGHAGQRVCRYRTHQSGRRSHSVSPDAKANGSRLRAGRCLPKTGISAGSKYAPFPAMGWRMKTLFGIGRDGGKAARTPLF